MFSLLWIWALGMVGHGSAELENPGFERGFYGWSDRTRWASHGIGGADVELAEVPHWQLSTNTPHSGRYCATIQLPPYTNSYVTFEPELVTSHESLQKGSNYVVSVWVRVSSPMNVSVQVTDLCCGYIGLSHWIDQTSDWQRIVVPLYRYAEKGENPEFENPFSGAPYGGWPARLVIAADHAPWARTLWVDDARLDRVTESNAYEVMTWGDTFAPPWTESAESQDPLLLSTSLGSSWPYRMLEPTNSLFFPIDIAAPSANEVTDTVDLVVKDFTGQPIYATQIPFALSSGHFSSAFSGEVLEKDGALPVGMYMYEMSISGISQRATDRFYVRAPSPSLRNLDPDDSFFAIDHDLLTRFRSRVDDVPRHQLQTYEIEHHLSLLSQLGAGYVRLWIWGKHSNEVDALENAVDALIAAGFEPLVLLDGYVQSNVYYDLSYNSYQARGDPGAWHSFVGEMVDRFSGRVEHWELLNERWDWPAAAYVALLTNTYAAIKSRDSNATLHAFTQIFNTNELPKLEAYYKQGAAPFAEVVDYHAYFPISEAEVVYPELKRIVHRYEDGILSYDDPGQVFLPATNAPIWMSEFRSAWSKLYPGNRISRHEIDRAVYLLKQMILAKAYAIEKFFHFSITPEFAHNGMFGKAMHEMASSPMVSLQYAACDTFMKTIGTQELTSVFVDDVFRAYGFGTRQQTQTAWVVCWATNRTEIVTLATNITPVVVVRMDGSTHMTNNLALGDAPVFLRSTDGSPYDWTQAFGTNRVGITE